MEQPVDGFEGVGLLVELFIGIVVSVVVLFLATVYRKLSKGQKDVKRSVYVWASLFVYALSVLCGLQFATYALTDDVRRTALLATVGTTLAISALAFALISRGAGRILAAVSSAFLTILWLPMFFGRVLGR